MRSPRIRQTGPVRARSAVFDLYGDHLPEHGHWAPIAAIVALLQAVGIQPSATRTAVSRLAAQGWLEPDVRGGVRGYAATAGARERLAAAHQRIYRRQPEPWDGCWHLVLVDHGGDRAVRERVAGTLAYLGYGRLDTRTWVAPRPNPEVTTALAALGVRRELFRAEQQQGTARALGARVWDLDRLADQYRRFRDDTLPLLDRARQGTEPEEAYPMRTRLVHEWRKFLFVDPDLPAEALPPDWPGEAARRVFLEVADALEPPARIFVSSALARAGAPATGG
jgi:phenylacetic acid degradation operon negative regulatory protein